MPANWVDRGLMTQAECDEAGIPFEVDGMRWHKIVVDDETWDWLQDLVDDG